MSFLAVIDSRMIHETKNSAPFQLDQITRILCEPKKKNLKIKQLEGSKITFEVPVELKFYTNCISDLYTNFKNKENFSLTLANIGENLMTLSGKNHLGVEKIVSEKRNKILNRNKNLRLFLNITSPDLREGGLKIDESIQSSNFSTINCPINSIPYVNKCEDFWKRKILNFLPRIKFQDIRVYGQLNNKKWPEKNKKFRTNINYCLIKYTNYIFLENLPSFFINYSHTSKFITMTNIKFTLQLSSFKKFTVSNEPAILSYFWVHIDWLYHNLIIPASFIIKNFHHQLKMIPTSSGLTTPKSLEKWKSFTIKDWSVKNEAKTYNIKFSKKPNDLLFFLGYFPKIRGFSHTSDKWRKNGLSQMKTLSNFSYSVSKHFFFSSKKSLNNNNKVFKRKKILNHKHSGQLLETIECDFSSKTSNDQEYLILKYFNSNLNLGQSEVYKLI
mmetsp:Transcript_9186/g.14487  ORF Transcript_9186/g.14487 Transcript_9186/m.14487 type:complete len:443 (-) Transcript_9186:1333-2661(-)